MPVQVHGCVAHAWPSNHHMMWHYLWQLIVHICADVWVRGACMAFLSSCDVSFLMTMATTCQACVCRCMDAWRVHQPLWKQDKVSWTDKFIAKNPSTSAYEERMARYTKNAADIWRTAGNVNCSFVRVCTQALAAAVRDEALGWVKALRDGMQALDLQTLQVLIAGSSRSADDITLTILLQLCTNCSAK